MRTLAFRGLLGLALAGLAVSAGCYAPVVRGYPATPAPAKPAPVEGQLRSAQGSHIDSPAGDQRVWLVFDRAIDPTTLRAFNFILVFGDDHRAYPSAVHLAGADQGFDARSIVLEGEFLDADKAWNLARIQIVGPVYGADGVPFRGTSIAVAEPGEPLPVAARRLEETDAACPGGKVRVYFSDAVELAPEGDEAHELTFRRASNRIDICGGPSARLSLKEGLVIGTGKQVNGGGQVDIEVSR